MIRAPRPTDVFAYLAFRSQTAENEALIRADGKTAVPTVTALLGGSLEPRSERWVLVDRGQIVGLVGARARFGADVWDVDQLIASSSADTDRVYRRLLEHVCRQAVQEGVQKVFLRLHEESEALSAARHAGFVKYAAEHVHYQPEPRPSVLSVPDGLRPRCPIDHQAIFQLYCSAVPAFVRQVEGLTLQEWRWTDGWRPHPMPWRPGGLRRRDFALRDGGNVVAWLQVDPRGRQLALLVDSRKPEVARSVLAYGVAELGRGPITLPLREYQLALQPELEEQGFRPVARHALLARMLVSRVPEVRLVPIQAS